jgi:hypothetical protein
MANESPPNDRLKRVWQNQPLEGMLMSVDEIRRRAGKFQKEVYWRNAREYVAALAVVIFLGYTSIPVAILCGYGKDALK